MKNFLIGAVVVAVVLLGGIYVGGKLQTPPLGASSGTEHYNAENFYNVINYNALSSGPVLALTTAPTTTITGAQACSNGFFTLAPSVIAASTTLPTAASLIGNCLRNVGDVRTIWYENTSSTSFSVLAGSTSSTLQNSTSTAFVTAGKVAKITFLYDSATAGTVKILLSIFN